MISVCMAVFNGEEYLGDQLGSILTQLNADDEVIIVDDCSRDSSVNVIEGFHDPRIKVLHNRCNLGPAASFERAITRARGDLIFLSDQDDIWKPHKVSVTCRAFAAANILVVVSDAEIVDSARVSTGGSLFALRKSKAGFWRNLYKNGFVGCCMAFRSEARHFLLPFPVSAGLHDEWIGLCCSIAGRVSFVAQPLVQYRRHERNVTQLTRGLLPAMVRKRLRLSLAITLRFPRIVRWRVGRRRPATASAD